MTKYEALDHAANGIDLAPKALCHARGALSLIDCCAVHFARSGCTATGGASCIIGLLRRRGYAS